MAVNWDDFEPVNPGPVPLGKVDWSRFEPVSKTPRSLLSEVPIQLYAGASIDLPKQVGQAMQWMSSPGNPAYERGKEIADWAARREEENPDLEPQTEGRGIVGRALTGGARAIVPSVALVLPAAATAMAAPAMGVAALTGAAVGSAAGAFGLFGASQAQDTYAKLLKSGVPENEAREAGWINLMIEGGGETLGNIAGLKLFGLAGKALSKGVSPVAGAMANATSNEFVMPFLKQLPKTVATEIATEFGQNAGEAWVENRYGAKDAEDPWKAGIQGAESALGMTLLLAPFGLAGFAHRAKTNEKVANALQNENSPIANRMAAATIMFREINAVDPDAAKAWAQNSSFAIATRSPILLDESSTIAQKSIAERAADEANARIAQIGSATTVDQAIRTAVTAPEAINVAELARQDMERNLAGRQVLEAAQKAQDEEIAALHMELQRLMDQEPATAMQAAYKPKREAAIRSRLAALGVDIEEAPETQQKPAESIPDAPWATPFAPPQTVAGRPESELSIDELRAMIDYPGTPAITRHAAIAALQARNVSRETQGESSAIPVESADAGGLQRSLGQGNAIQGPAMGGGNAQPGQTPGTQTAPVQGADRQPPAVTPVAAPPAPPAVAPPAQLPAGAAPGADQANLPPPAYSKMTGKALNELARNLSGKKRLSADQTQKLAWVRAELDRRADEKAARPQTEKQKAQVERLKKQAAGRKKIDVRLDTLLPAIAKLGGINISERQDILGDKGNHTVPFVGHLFTKDGTGVDDMATRLAAYGYMTRDEIADFGGVQALKDKIADEFSGRRKHWSIDSSEHLEREAEDAYALAQEMDEAIKALNADDLDVGMVAAAEELESEGIEVSVANELNADLIAKATSLDEAGFERLSQQMEGASDKEFMAAVVEFIKERENANQRPNAAQDHPGQETGQEAAGTQAEEVARPALELQADQLADQNQNRFEAGKSLNAEQRKQTLATLTDVYRANGLKKVLVGSDSRGEEIWRYPYSPDYFEKSDITGAMVRYYVTLPDGRIAHPTELFPNYSQNDIDAEMDRRRQERLQNIREAKRFVAEEFQFDSKAKAAQFWDDKSEKSKAQTVHGGYSIYPSTERIFLSNGGKFVMVPKTTSVQLLESLADLGWIQDRQKSENDFNLSQQTSEDLRAADAARKAAEEAERKAVAAREEAERKERERKEIRLRSETAANNSQLGQSAEDNLSGQGGLFEAAPVAAQKAEEPKPEAPSASPIAAAPFAGADLSKIMVNVKALEVETGKAIVTTERADIALRDNSQQMTKAKLLLECLRA